RRHTRFSRDWSSDVCSSDLTQLTASPDRRARQRAEVAYRFEALDPVRPGLVRRAVALPKGFGNSIALFLVHPHADDEFVRARFLAFVIAIHDDRIDPISSVVLRRGRYGPESDGGAGRDDRKQAFHVPSSNRQGSPAHEKALGRETGEHSMKRAKRATRSVSDPFGQTDSSSASQPNCGAEQRITRRPLGSGRQSRVAMCALVVPEP